MLASGKEASPYWGGSTNPDGSKKKVAKYDTKEKQTSRQNENGKLRTQRKAKVRKGFLQRRTEVEKKDSHQILNEKQHQILNEKKRS